MKDIAKTCLAPPLAYVVLVLVGMHFLIYQPAGRRMESRFDRLEARFDGIDSRFDRLDERLGGAHTDSESRR